MIINPELVRRGATFTPTAGPRPALPRLAPVVYGGGMPRRETTRLLGQQRRAVNSVFRSIGQPKRVWNQGSSLAKKGGKLMERGARGMVQTGRRMGRRIGRMFGL